MQCTPILFFINNDTQANQIIFNEIKKFEPCKIYFSHISESFSYNNEKAENDIELLSKQINWDCVVRTKFNNKENHNHHEIICNSIDWFFLVEELGIILNNDILPSQFFFIFCENMLSYYKEDSRIMFVNSSNYQEKKEIGDGTYFFSKYNQIGAWATWKRAWELIQPNINKLSNAVRLKAFDGYLTHKEFEFWITKIQLETSDPYMQYNYKTLLSQWLNNGLAITPSISLVKPLKKESTTKYYAPSSFSYELERFERMDIKHPTIIIKNNQADKSTFKRLYLKEAREEKIIIIKQKIKKYLYLFNKKIPSIVKNTKTFSNSDWHSVTNDKNNLT